MDKWLIFILGIIMGGILFSREFRKGFSSFIATSGQNLYKIGKSKKEVSDQSKKKVVPKQILQEEETTIKVTTQKKLIPKVIYCEECDGTGVVEKENNQLAAKIEWIICSACKGSGLK